MSEFQRPPLRPRRRGCLTGCLPQLFGLAVLGVVVVLGVNAIVAPWIYTVGHRTRFYPLWEGWGVAHDAARGGDYDVYLWFSPEPGGSHILPSTNVAGWGTICTPSGKTYPLRVYGSTRGVVRNDMDGRPFSFSLENRPWNWNFVPDSAWLPKLTLAGRWSGDSLAMTDQGTLDAAFLPDGRLNPNPPYVAPVAGAGVPITIAEAGKSGFDAACTAHAR